MRFIVATFAALIGTGIAGQLALHDFASGLWVGLIIFAWVSQALRTTSSNNDELMFFDTLECELSLSEAFEEVKRVLGAIGSETGQKWIVTTDDTAKALTADTTIAITGSSSQFLIRPAANVRLQFAFEKKAASNTSIIEMEWQPLQPNLDPQSFAHLKNSTMQRLASSFTQVSKPSVKLKSPPSWLHTATLVCTIAYSVSCAKSIETRLNSQQKESDQIGKYTETVKRELRDLEREYAEWQHFKQAQGSSSSHGETGE